MSWLKKSSGPEHRIDFDFNAINHTDYELALTIPDIRNTMMLRLFALSKQRLKRKNGYVIDKHPDDIEEFHVPPIYLKLLTTGIGRHLKNIDDEIGKDGIKVFTRQVVSAKFQRGKDDKKDWVVTIKITGTYIDKR